MKTVQKIFIMGCLFLLPYNLLLAEVREPAVAGAFYPKKAQKLRTEVERYLAQADINKSKLSQGQIVGVVAPHAGYPYSGSIAGYAFKVLKSQHYDTVVVLGPNHTVWGFNDVSIWAKGVFRTPLGDIPIDSDLAKAIIAEDPKKFVFSTRAHAREHAIEVELPFLQVVLGDFKLVPIVIGDSSEKTCQKLAQAIKNNIGDKKVLIVASCDLSHDKNYDQAVMMDKLGLLDIVKQDIPNFVKNISSKKTEMCGYGPVLTLLSYNRLLGGIKGVLLKYENSGDVIGNRKSRIVGYGAVAFFKEGEKMSNNYYTLEDRQALLELARGTIENYLSKQQAGSKEMLSPKFSEKRGVFVTLHKKGNLRGCIGYIEPIKPLQDAVMDNAISAATKDFRFSQVTNNELKDIDIEISILTPPEEIKGPEDFIPGTHGIIIRKGFRSAVFLPQVAPEQGWDRATTLSHLCLKAGLSQDEWQKPGVKFFVFTAEVFGEKQGGE